MKKLIALVVVVIMVVFCISCNTHERCPAYTQANLDVQEQAL